MENVLLKQYYFRNYSENCIFRDLIELHISLILLYINHNWKT